MTRGIAVLALLGMLPWAGLNAQHQQAFTIFKVTATVQAVCEMTAPDLAFGTYAAQNGSPLQSTPLLLRATCSPDSTYNIGLNKGRSPGATVNQQRMGAASQVPDDRVTGTGTGLAVDHTLFGSVPASQVIPEAGYANTITVLIYY